MIQGNVMKIARLRMGTDGAGVTTLVALFDCHLQCVYCINDHCHRYQQKIREEIVSNNYTPVDLIKVLEKDSIYFIMSGGGITFGGGEPLLQSEFIDKVCAIANPMWKIRIETSLNVPYDRIHPLKKYVDKWIIDIKDWNPDIYFKYTGIDNNLLVDNLEKLYKAVGKDKIHIRIPRIPNYNTEKDVEYSVRKIRELYGIEPEVFDYVVSK